MQHLVDAVGFRMDLWESTKPEDRQGAKLLHPPPGLLPAMPVPETV
ncbi:MAG: hypothetical protein ACXWWH_04430 [Nitrospira sp.]